MRTRTKLLLTAGVLGVIGLLVVLATGAFFSDTTESQNNIAATGTMAVECEGSAQAVPGFAPVCGEIFATPGPTTMKPVLAGLPSLRDNLAAARLPSATITGTMTVQATGTIRVDKLVLDQTAVSGYDPDGAGPQQGLHSLLNICVGDDQVDAIDANDPDPDGPGPLDSTNADPAGDCDVYMGPFDMGATTATAFDVANPLTPAAIPTGGTRTFEFEVWFPDDGTDQNAYQNQSAQANFRMTAT